MVIMFLYLKANDSETRVWQRSCKDDQCVGQDDVKLSIRSRTGEAELRKRLLQVTYRPQYFSKTKFLKRGKPDLPARLVIECGAGNFRSLEGYPDVLCGGCRDTGVLQLHGREKPSFLGWVGKGGVGMGRTRI